MTINLLTDIKAIVDPAHTAVLAIDLQNDFCATGGHTEVNLKNPVEDCQGVVEPIATLVTQMSLNMVSKQDTQR